MKIRHIILSAILLTSTIWSQAQQVNPVPDYVFRNQMSVGRNAVTDTAAYFSIGPRYGANKGFMPPIVGDTATFSSGKRNGLLIFSVQKNKFLYWDSVRVQWSDMAGSSGAYIVAGDTATMLAPYLRKADTTAMLSPYYRSATATAALALKLNISDTSTMLGNYIRHAGYGLTKSGQSFLVDTLNISTRAWRQKGLDSLAALEVSGSGTTNYVPKFTGASTIGNSQIFDNGTNVGIGTGTPLAKLHIGNGSQSATNGASTKAQIMDGNSGGRAALLTLSTSSGAVVVEGQYESDASSADLRVIMGSSTNHPVVMRTNNAERLRIFANGRVFVGASPSDAGYQFDINGTLRSVNGANFATTSGNVGVGTASPAQKLDVAGIIRSKSGTTGTVYLGETVSTAYNAAAIIATPSTSYDRTGRLSIQLPTHGAGTDYGLTEQMSIQVNTSDSKAATMVLLPFGGNVGIGTASPLSRLQISGETVVTNGIPTSTANGLHFFFDTNVGYITSEQPGTTFRELRIQGSPLIFQTAGTERGRINSAGEWIIDASGTDAGDYKLQVVGNARIGTGKLDIASNTTFGLGIARSGTSEVAGQIYNSNGIFYTGVESSAGGQIFTGSSAYAAVIGSGANYPFQIATNNITRATMTTQGNFMLGFTTDSYFYRLQVNGSIFTNNQILIQNSAAQLHVDSTTNLSPIYLSNQSLTGTSAQGLIYGNMTWNTTGAPSAIDLNVTNTASGADANYIKITDGSNIFRVTKDAGIITGIPSGGSAKKWKLGAAATVSPTSPNRTIQIEVDGVVYYLHAKTTND